MRINRFTIIIILLVANVVFWPNKKEEALIYEEIKTPTSINVTIEGEVAFPGSYFFYEEITVGEVVNFAGGFTKNADASKLSLTEKIKKDRKIVVSKIVNSDNPIINLNKVNINTASFQELINVPNITEKRAANIIIYRESNGLFASIEELLKVKYIGEAVFEKVREYVTI